MAVPPFNNPSIQAQFYQPSQFVISAITLGTSTTITTTLPHNFVVGNLVRILIPSSFGTYQLNERKGYVLSIPSTTSVVIGINSTSYDAYVSSTATTVAQIIAIGDINSGAINATGLSNMGTSVPGSFINISPL
jgi:hypothetical protein